MKEDRKQIMQGIMELRKSNLLCYISGDRQTVSTRVAPDIIPVLYEHLKAFGTCPRIDLFLFTKGGDVLTTLRMVHLIYEFTDQFCLLVPYKAYSAGTLIGLGASEIVMTKMGELSPVDPNVTGIFNPENTQNAGAKLPISVEDVYSFFSVAKKLLNMKSEESMARVLAHLVDHVNPLALGNIERTHSLIRVVATKLLRMHLKEETRIKDIVDNLTEKLFSHSYMISRKEAREVGLPVTDSHTQLEELLWALYESYMNDFSLDKPFSPEFEANRDGQFGVCSGIIESYSRLDRYMFDGVIQSSDQVGEPLVSIISQGWRKSRRKP